MKYKETKTARKERVASTGCVRTRIVNDKTKYTRKSKYKSF